MSGVYVPTLELANAIRIPRARILREVRALPEPQSRERAARLIEETPPELESMSVERFLKNVRRIGPAAAEEMLDSLHISAHRSLHSLRVRDRMALALALRC